MPIALPIPRSVFTRLGYGWVTHVTPQKYLLGQPGQPGIVRKAILRNRHDWSLCEVELRASSGFGNHGTRLLRDYSVLDFELTLSARGSYTYFFCGDPSRWGLAKNIGVSSESELEAKGLAMIRITLPQLLAVYQGPLFFRPDDQTLVIRGGYIGAAEVKSLPIA